MEKSLVVVESPAKAKTIGKYLGPSYIVESSMGHVRDLPKSSFGVDIEKGFVPRYQTLPARRKLLSKLKDLASKADAVYLASDLDREGEAIAWHIAEALKLPKKKTFRVVFNEITKRAIQEAFRQPGRINMDKVCAQQARRILDRIVGYELSPLLWKKIARGLSAGRVQSVAVRLIVEREREIRAFKPEEYWRIFAKLRPSGLSEEEGAEQEFKAELKRKGDEKVHIPNEQAAREIVGQLDDAQYIVKGIKQTKTVNNAPPPFTTSTMQQQASVRLGFTASRTMMIAQQLYEGVDLGPHGSVGLITYMRTDSVRLSEESVQACRALIPEKFGPEFLPEKPNTYAPRGRAQEAHEAIRPTDVTLTPDMVSQYLSPEQAKLYQLIWNRFVASQMKPAIYHVTDAEIQAGDFVFIARGRQLVFPGHTLLTGHTLKADEQILPPLEEGQLLDLLGLDPQQRFTKPPPRYTEATLVRALEQKGIGRPSTYATIIRTIQERGYVEKRGRLFHATDLGMVVTDKLVKHFPQILDVEFTSHMEEELDKIEEGEIEWKTVLQEFYEPFKQSLEAALREMTHIKQDVQPTDEKCEKCGRPMVIRWGRNGWFMACSGYPECKNRRSLPSSDEKEENKSQSEESSETGEDEICDLCGKPMVVRHGRRGPFLACSGYPECRNTRPLASSKRQGKEPPVETDQVCEKCGSKMVIRTGVHGKFLACSAFPKCRNTKPLDENGNAAEPEPTNEVCEKCGQPMVLRTGPNGKFLACSAYPKCRFTKSVPTDVTCPACGKGKLILKRARRGRGSRFFYGCTCYPDCTYTTRSLEQLDPPKTNETEKPKADSGEATDGGQAA